MPRRFMRFLFLASSLSPAAGCAREPAAPPPAAGIILFVGDGMGVAVVTAARIHKGAVEGLPRPVEAELNLDRAPRAALLRTWCTDNMVTDSAAGITALLSGAKVPMGAVGADRGPGGGTDTLATVFEIAKSLGLATGVVTTTRLTHATPAGAFAHTLDRHDENAIALGLVPGGNPRLGDGIDVILGGGQGSVPALRDGSRAPIGRPEPVAGDRGGGLPDGGRRRGARGSGGLRREPGLRRVHRLAHGLRGGPGSRAALRSRFPGSAPASRWPGRPMGEWTVRDGR